MIASKRLLLRCSDALPMSAEGRRDRVASPGGGTSRRCGLERETKAGSDVLCALSLNEARRGCGPSSAPLSRLSLIVRATIMSGALRSEEHTSELQSLMSISYAVFCL